MTAQIAVGVCVIGVAGAAAVYKLQTVGVLHVLRRCRKDPWNAGQLIFMLGVLGFFAWKASTTTRWVAVAATVAGIAWAAFILHFVGVWRNEEASIALATRGEFRCPYCQRDFDPEPSLVWCPHCAQQLPKELWDAMRTGGPGQGPFTEPGT